VGPPPAHAQAARRDIASCAGCHDQGGQAVCVTCHGGTSPALRINPHPQKFLSKHDLGDVSKNDMCRVCHR
jgi:hypothetical protein